MPNEQDPLAPRYGLSAELREVLAFTESENQKHRDYFQMLYKWTAGALTIIVVVIASIVAFVGWHTVEDIRKQAQNATQEEIENIRQQSKETLGKQTSDIQAQITTKLDNEFKTDAIRQTVQSAAKQQTAGALLPIITSEVRTQVSAGVKSEQQNVQRSLIEEVHHSVEDLKPTIDKEVNNTVHESVNSAVTAQVDSQITPRLKQLENSAQLSTLINQAESGDAISFDTLVRMSADPQVLQNVRDLALKVAKSIVASNDSGIYVSRTFNDNPTESKKIAYLNNPDQFIRQAAVDSIPEEYWKGHLDQLFTMLTSDTDIRVRVSAFNRFRQITQIKAEALDNQTVWQWWLQHRKEFVK
jgi:hypothetical protein